MTSRRHLSLIDSPRLYLVPPLDQEPDSICRTCGEDRDLEGGGDSCPECSTYRARVRDFNDLRIERDFEPSELYRDDFNAPSISDPDF